MYAGRLLILEDDPHVGKVMRIVAEASGLEAHFLADTAEFLRETQDWNPTHIALDLIMPETDGSQIIAELAKRGCRANIIIASGMGARGLDMARRTATDSGLHIVGVLAKPFSTAALRKLLSDNCAVDESGAEAA